MHVQWSWNLTLGNVLAVGAILGAIIRVEMFIFGLNRIIDIVLREHEILIRDYCERRNLKVEDLPTRIGKIKF